VTVVFTNFLHFIDDKWIKNGDLLHVELNRTLSLAGFCHLPDEWDHHHLRLLQGAQQRGRRGEVKGRHPSLCPRRVASALPGQTRGLEPPALHGGAQEGRDHAEAAPRRRGDQERRPPQRGGGTALGGLGRLGETLPAHV